MFSCYAFNLQLLKKKGSLSLQLQATDLIQKEQFLRLSLSIIFVSNYAVFCISNLTHQYSFITVGHHRQLQSEDSTECWQTCTEV